MSAEISLAAELRLETIDAFEGYIASTETQLEPRFRGDHFLWPDESPQLKEQLLHGSIVVKPSQGNGIVAIKGGLIEDWMGVAFIPNADLKSVLSTVQDYNHHGEVYKPDISRRQDTVAGRQRFSGVYALSQGEILSLGCAQ